MSKVALWLTRHWPFNTQNRISYHVYLWLIGVGSKAFIEEIYGLNASISPGDPEMTNAQKIAALDPKIAIALAKLALQYIPFVKEKP